MKKQILKAFLTIAIVSAASSAMAASSIIGQVTLGAGNSFTPSAKVGMSVMSTTIAYSATSCHLTGTKEYGTVAGTGTTGDPSKIYSKAIPSQGTNTVGIPDPPTAATALPGSNWE